MSDLQNAVKKLHEIGPKTVAVSSTELGDKLTAIFSTIKGNKKMMQLLERNTVYQNSFSFQIRS